MSGEVQKVGYSMPVSDETLNDSHALRDSWEIAVGMRPDPRTPEQIESDRAERFAEQRRARSEIEAMHAAVMADAHGLRRAVLELHGPKFHDPDSADARCDGCESSGYDAEQPGFPCQTYELAVKHRSV